MASFIISLKPEIIRRCRAETLRVGAGPAAPQELPLRGRPDPEQRGAGLEGR